jgi:hypothetical protein
MRTGVWMRCPGKDGASFIYTQRGWDERSRYDCNYKVRCVKTLQSGILGIIQRENTA